MKISSERTRIDLAAVVNAAKLHSLLSVGLILGAASKNVCRRNCSEERESITDQLAVAVGLGGRNRKAASQAERARSAVTKCIKGSIHKIEAAMPPLSAAIWAPGSRRDIS